MEAPNPQPTLVACHYCDLLHEKQPLARKERAVCGRCGGILYKGGHDVLSRTLSYTIASLLLLVVANIFPFMDFKIAGRVQEGYLLTGVINLYHDGYAELAAMVLFTSVLAPLILLSCLLSLTLPVVTGHRPIYMAAMAKLVRRIKDWAMMEGFLLGVLVSAVKLAGMADLVFGPAFFAFIALIVTSTAAVAVFDPDVVWDHLGWKHRR